eukprot:145731_1
MSNNIATEVESPTEWISKCVVYLLAIIVNGLILLREVLKRKSERAHFTTKSLEYTSIFTVLCGLIASFFGFMDSFNIFCTIGTNGSWIFEFFQVILMGFYQLSRLHYCFAQSQVHSNKGYPNWLINLMYAIGVCIGLSSLCWAAFGNPISCGINTNYEMVRTYSDTENNLWIYFIWLNVTITLYLIWDLGTLSLYINKRQSFRKFESENIDIYRRIALILNRILILTVFYELIVLLAMIIALLTDFYPHVLGVHGSILHYFVLELSNVATSYSMIMMQEHNNQEYHLCLKITYAIGLCHVCCCCFQSNVRYELDIHKKEKEKEMQNVENEIATTNTRVDDTSIWHTVDNTIKMEHSVPRQVSIPTVMQTELKL